MAAASSINQTAPSPASTLSEERYQQWALVLVILVACKPVSLLSNYTLFALAVSALAFLFTLQRLIAGIPIQRFSLITAYLTVTLYLLWPGSRGLTGLPGLFMIGALLILCIDTKNLDETIDKFCTIIIVLITPGIIQFIIFLITGNIIGEDFSWKHGGSIVEAKYFIGNIVSKNLVYDSFIFRTYRFQGIFDEPGRLGTMFSLILCYRKYNLRNLNNKILFLCGVASLSLAFIAISLIYFALQLIIGLQRRRATIIFAFISIATVSVWQYAEQLPLVSRLATAQETGDVDNRTTPQFDATYKRTIVDGSFERALFGFGNAAHTQMGDDVSSWKTLIFNHGILGITLIAVLLTIIALSNSEPNGTQNSRKQRLAMIPVILAALYQRPDVFEPFYFAIFVASMRTESLTGAARSKGIAETGNSITEGTVG